MGCLRSLPCPTVVVLSEDGSCCDHRKLAAMGSVSGATMGKLGSEASRLRLWVGKSLVAHYLSCQPMPDLNILL